MTHADSTITNFGGNLHFMPNHRYTPTTEDEVLEILNRHAHGKIRVVGALHSWSPAIVCEDVIVDMRNFDRVEVETKPDGAVWATVGGGCRIKDLLKKLHALGDHTMPTLGLVTEQTIAGAISTATHGSGRHSLSHYMDEIRIAAFDAQGIATVYHWRDGPELRAARCALGCMGIILSVRFRCVPKYEVEETMVACATIDDALASEADFPLQQFYLVPHLWSYFVQRRRMTGSFSSKRALSARLYRVWWFLFIDLGLHIIIKTLVSFLNSPALTRFFFRHVLPKTILKNTPITDHSEQMLVMEHELFKHLEIEIFVPAQCVRAASEFVRGVLEVYDGATDWQTRLPFAAQLESVAMLDELKQRIGVFTYHYTVTFRRVSPDDTLISMTGSAVETYYAISLITYAEPREPFYELGSFLARSMVKLFDARLHWGKYFPFANADIEGSYPDLAEFRAICRRVDPHGVFRNDFVNRVLFNASAS